MKIAITHIKKHYSIIDIAKRIGVQVYANNTCKCPFHKEGQENNPSMSFHIESNTFKCFACDAKGSNIDLVMKYLNYNFREAVNYIVGHNVFSALENNKTPSYVGKQSYEDTTKPTLEPIVNTNYHEIYSFMLNGTKYTSSDNFYLKSRGLITIGGIKGIEIKTIVDAKKLETELVNKFSMDTLISCGLFNEYEKFVYENNYLLMPYFYKDNKIITIKARDTKEKIYKNLKGRPLYLYGINHLYNGITLETTKIDSKDIKNVYICEGEIDALSLLEVGLIAVAVSGSNNWKDLYTRELLKYYIIFAGDNDKAGETMYNKLVLSFSKYGRPINRVDLTLYKGAKDINELLNK